MEMIILTLANKKTVLVMCQFLQSLASLKPQLHQLSFHQVVANVPAVIALAFAVAKVEVHVLAIIIAVDVTHWANVQELSKFRLYQSKVAVRA